MQHVSLCTLLHKGTSFPQSPEISILPADINIYQHALLLFHVYITKLVSDINIWYIVQDT